MITLAWRAPKSLNPRLRNMCSRYFPGSGAMRSCKGQPGDLKKVQDPCLKYRILVPREKREPWGQEDPWAVRSVPRNYPLRAFDLVFCFYLA